MEWTGLQLSKPAETMVLKAVRECEGQSSVTAIVSTVISCAPSVTGQWSDSLFICFDDHEIYWASRWLRWSRRANSRRQPPSHLGKPSDYGSHLIETVQINRISCNPEEGQTTANETRHQWCELLQDQWNSAGWLWSPSRSHVEQTGPCPSTQVIYKFPSQRQHVEDIREPGEWFIGEYKRTRHDKAQHIRWE